MNSEEIKQQFPSICYNCKNNRRPASDENTKKGYVGCCLFAKKESGSIYFLKEAKEAGDGWVDLRSNVFGEASGVISNYQLLTLEVTECTEFELKK